MGSSSGLCWPVQALSAQEGFRAASCPPCPLAHLSQPWDAVCPSHLLCDRAGQDGPPWWHPQASSCPPLLCRTRAAHPTVQIPEEGQGHVLWPEDHAQGTRPPAPRSRTPATVACAALSQRPRPAGQSGLGAQGGLGEQSKCRERPRWACERTSVLTGREVSRLLQARRAPAPQLQRVVLLGFGARSP